MAVTKTIIKMNHNEAIVKIVNDAATSGTATITLAVDLLNDNEELFGGAPQVNIGAQETAVSVGNEITIVRNGAVIMQMFENTDGNEMPWGADTQNNTADIVVNFTGKSTIYLRLLKFKGYRPKFRPEQGVNL